MLHSIGHALAASTFYVAQPLGTFAASPGGLRDATQSDALCGIHPHRKKKEHDSHG
jgi:hypothetical protein